MRGDALSFSLKKLLQITKRKNKRLLISKLYFKSILILKLKLCILYLYKWVYSYIP